MMNTNGSSDHAGYSSQEYSDFLARASSSDGDRLTADEMVRSNAHLFGEVAWRSITVDDTIQQVGDEHFRLMTDLIDKHWDFKKEGPRSILEIAAYAHTTGYSLKEKYGANVTLFDISDCLLDEGRKLAGYTVEDDNPRRVAGDFHDLPFEDESFDVVSISSAMHHSWEWEKVLGEMQRVLAPGGLLFLENEPCRRECCFYSFRTNRPEKFTAFEKVLDDLGVLRTFSEPCLGSREEKLFGIVENMEIPLDRIMAKVEEESQLVDMSLFPENSLTSVDNFWINQADLGPRWLAEVIEKKLTEAHEAALPYLDRATRAQGFQLPDIEEIGPFAWRMAVRLCALPPRSSEQYRKMMISDTFGAAARIVARKHGERKRPATGAFRRAVEKKDGVYYGFREDVSRFLMERHSLLPDIQNADQAELDKTFPPAQWSRRDLDNDFALLKLVDQPGAIRVSASNASGVLVLRCEGGVEQDRHAKMRIEQEGREIYSIDLWRSESFLCVTKLVPGNNETDKNVHVYYEIEDDNGSFIPSNDHLSLVATGLFEVGEMTNPAPVVETVGVTESVGENITSQPRGASPRLSVVVNTLNEEESIEACLKTVEDIADEIVVVDMKSDDRTVEIARRFTDRIFEHERTGVVEPAREFAIQKTTGDWILIIDADERVSPELAAGIQCVIADPKGVDIFRIPRKNYIAGRWMEGTGLGPDVERQPRLFRKGKLIWPGEIHAAPVMLGKEGLLPLPAEARIDHYAYSDLHDFVDRLNRYTDHEAQTLNMRGAEWSPDTMMSAAGKEFGERYDPRSDGVHSLVLSISMAYYRFLTWAKLWEKRGYPDVPLPEDLGECIGMFAEHSVPETDADRPVQKTEAVERIPEVCVEPVYGSGFHKDEGGWRWMDREGLIEVDPDCLPAVVHLSLSSGGAICHNNFPFHVQVYNGSNLAGKVVFQRSEEDLEAKVLLNATDDPWVRLVCSETFVPAELGVNEDDRNLSIRVTGVEITPAAGGAGRSPEKNAEQPPAEESPRPMPVISAQEEHTPAAPPEKTCECEETKPIRRRRDDRSVRIGLLMADSNPVEDWHNGLAPLAFGYFSSFLKEHMPEAEIVFRFTPDELLAEDVDIVGISSSTEEYERAKRLAAEVKEKSDLPVLIGGVHISILPNNMTRHMDVAVIGEGEITLKELLGRFLARGKRFLSEDLHKIEGIAFRENGTLVQTPRRAIIKPLDSLAFPDRKKIWIGKPGDRTFMFTTRGCPFKCAFCASSRFWASMRHFSAGYVVDEIEHIHNDLGLNRIHFFDDLFITPKKRLREMSRMIEERGLNKVMTLSGAVHAHLINDELCELLTRMNVVEVMFGAESFSPKVLDYLKCGSATPEDNQRTIDLLHKHGIKANLSMIYGSQVETKEDLDMSLTALEENLRLGKVNRWQRGRLRLYPGTPMWDEALKAGTVSEDMNWDEIRCYAKPYVGIIPEQELAGILREHEERCIAINPDNAQQWLEWGLSKKEVVETLAKRSPDQVLSFIDFNGEYREAQMVEGWYGPECSNGKTFRWMSRRSTTYLRGIDGPCTMKIRGAALLDQFKNNSLTLTILVNDKLVGKAMVDEPTFALSADIPWELSKSDLLEVCIVASDCFTSPPDVRQLSIIVSGIGLVEDEARCTVGITGQTDTENI